MHSLTTDRPRMLLVGNMWTLGSKSLGTEFVCTKDN